MKKYVLIAKSGNAICVDASGVIDGDVEFFLVDGGMAPITFDQVEDAAAFITAKNRDGSEIALALDNNKLLSTAVLREITLGDQVEMVKSWSYPDEIFPTHAVTKSGRKKRIDLNSQFYTIVDDAVFDIVKAVSARPDQIMSRSTFMATGNVSGRRVDAVLRVKSESNPSLKGDELVNSITVQYGVKMRVVAAGRMNMDTFQICLETI